MALNQNHQNGVSILDIRRNEMQFSMIDELHSGLRPPQGGEKRMPTMLLYDEKGLKLFEDITYLEEYYLTNAEIEVLERYAGHIAERIHNGSQVVELGSGNLRKVNILLQALDKAEKHVDYYALDLSLSELQRTLSAVPKGTYRHVHCHGLLGTYDDGLEWLKLPQINARPKCILHLGSSIGNFNREEAAQFLKGFGETLKPTDVMLIGVDGCQDPKRVYHAYNDREGKTHEFVRNGLTHANELLGKEAFSQADWEVIGEYDVAAGRHQAFYVPLKDLGLDGISFVAGEKVRIEESYKYSEIQTEQLWEAAGLAAQSLFGDHTGQYRIHMVTVPEFSFSLNPVEYAAKPVPTLQEFEQLWAAWDTVTKAMIPNKELLSKPIKLRNCCLFYLGHIPTFLDIHLTRVTNGEPTEPSSYPRFFQRGIDPDVDNPEHCHAHSETPDSWPPVHEIRTFQEAVRDRARKLYETNSARKNRGVGRALWLGFEHEAMHLETLLYMLLQSEKTIPPPGIKPDFEALADQGRTLSVPNQWITVPTREVNLGLADADDDFGPDRYFGWDCEKPVRSVTVPSFEAKARPITNEDYGRYLAESHRDAPQHSWPASWTVLRLETHEVKQNGWRQHESNGETTYTNGHSKPLTDAFLRSKAVRTVYGPVPLEHALAWPVIASYDELAGCAKWMDGRIPTMEEARSLYDYADELKAKDKGEVRNGTIPAVNGHLSNDGVEESPPSHPSRKSNSNTESGLDPMELFTNLEGCNVGFKHFHPTPVTQNGSRLSGQGEMGGVWEWTSSVLEKHDGFEPIPLYPEYTADFFDGKHNIVLGGSWATHPRIAGRKTFVNWYQRNYPYVWAGARLVRDL